MACDADSEILITQDTSGQSKDPGFFTENARRLVSGVAMQLITFEGDKATLPEVASIILSNRVFGFCATAMETGDSYVRDRLSDFGAKDAVLLKGGLADTLREARRQLKWLSNPAIARVLQSPKTPWRFGDLKRGSRPSTVYISVPPKYVETGRRLFALLLGSCFTELQSTPPGRWPVSCIADEFPMIQLSMFGTVFAEGAGHGFNVVAVAQNAGQMIASYGHEGFRNFLSCSEIQVWLLIHRIIAWRAIECFLYFF